MAALLVHVCVRFSVALCVFIFICFVVLQCLIISADFWGSFHACSPGIPTLHFSQRAILYHGFATCNSHRQALNIFFSRVTHSEGDSTTATTNLLRWCSVMPAFPLKKVPCLLSSIQLLLLLVKVVCFRAKLSQVHQVFLQSTTDYTPTRAARHVMCILLYITF